MMMRVAADTTTEGRDKKNTDDKRHNLLGPRSRLGDKPHKFQVVCPQNLSTKRDCGPNRIGTHDTDNNGKNNINNNNNNNNNSNNHKNNNQLCTETSRANSRLGCTRPHPRAAPRHSLCYVARPQCNYTYSLSMVLL